MKATKRQWYARNQILNDLAHECLSDALIAAAWDAVGKTAPLAKQIERAKVSYVRKYAVMEGGEPQTTEDLPESVVEEKKVVQVGEDEVVLSDVDAYEDAMDDLLSEEVHLDIDPVPLRAALSSDVPLSELRRALSWMIEVPANGEVEAEPVSA